MSKELDDDLMALELELEKKKRVELEVESRKLQAETAKAEAKRWRWIGFIDYAKGLGVTTALVVALGGGIVGWHQYWGGGPEARHAAQVVEDKVKYEKSWPFQCAKAGGIPAGGNTGYYVCTFPNGAVLQD